MIDRVGVFRFVVRLIVLEIMLLPETISLLPLCPHVLQWTRQLVEWEIDWYPAYKSYRVAGSSHWDVIHLPDTEVATISKRPCIELETLFGFLILETIPSLHLLPSPILSRWVSLILTTAQVSILMGNGKQHRKKPIASKQQPR